MAFVGVESLTFTGIDVEDDVGDEASVTGRKQATEQRQYTLVMGMRSWLFDQFRYLQRGSA